MLDWKAKVAKASSPEARLVSSCYRVDNCDARCEAAKAVDDCTIGRRTNLGVVSALGGFMNNCDLKPDAGAEALVYCDKIRPCGAPLVATGTTS